MNKILRATSDLTKSRRERILEELKGNYVDFEPVLLKAGSSAVVGIFSKLTDRKKIFAKLKSLQIPAIRNYITKLSLLTCLPGSIGYLQTRFRNRHYIPQA